MEVAAVNRAIIEATKFAARAKLTITDGVIRILGIKQAPKVNTAYKSINFVF